MLDTKLILARITEHQPILLADTELAAAIMVLLLVDEQDNLYLILTKRAITLPHYAGDFSFPGGMYDEADKTLNITAARELQEELGINSSLYRMIGELDDFYDHRGHLVRPFVALMEKKLFENNYVIAPDEISNIYYLPIQQLENFEDNAELHKITRRKPSYSFTDQEVFIWGLTAAIIVHLDNVMFGKMRTLGKTI